MRELVRLTEPWRVIRDGERFTVCDANGVMLVEVPQRDGTRQANDGLTDTEAEELARLIARLPDLSRRPQY
jgi:hypothetical protein